MIYVNWMFESIEQPVEDIEAHVRLIEERMRYLLWVDEEKAKQIRQEIDWRLREITRLVRKLELDMKKTSKTLV